LLIKTFALVSQPLDTPFWFPRPKRQKPIPFPPDFSLVSTRGSQEKKKSQIDTRSGTNPPSNICSIFRSQQIIIEPNGSPMGGHVCICLSVVWLMTNPVLPKYGTHIDKETFIYQRMFMVCVHTRRAINGSPWISVAPVFD
jgi:hypothetical protein